MQDPLASWAAIGTAIAGLAVALVTFLNILIARGSLRLMQRREERWQPNLRLHHLDAYAKTFKEQGFRVYAVNLRISNQSDVDNSIKDIVLSIAFRRPTSAASNVSLPCMTADTDTASVLIGRNPIDMMTVPSLIKAHGLISGWTAFQLANDLVAGAIIDAYQIRVVDTHDIESALDILTIVDRS